MGFDMSIDQLKMFSPNELGANSVFIDGVAIQGLFVKDYFEIATDNGVASSQPALLCRVKDIPTMARGASVVIDGVSYVTASKPRPNGTGIAEIPLERGGTL